MNKSPLISIVLCFLNPGEWLQEAIDSVINQTYKNWELLLVDDGSVETDSRLARLYAQSYPGKIYYIDHPQHRNIGLTASRNSGIRVAKGELVAFLDADDYWYPTKLMEQLLLFISFPTAEMICEASQFWYSWLHPEQEDPIITIGATEGLYLPGTLNKLLYPLGTGQPPCPSGIIIKKKLCCGWGCFRKLSAGFISFTKTRLFWLKFILMKRFTFPPQHITNTVSTKAPCTGAAGDSRLYAKVRNFFLDWLSDYLDEQNVDDEILKELIQAARLPLPAFDLE